MRSAVVMGRYRDEVRRGRRIVAGPPSQIEVAGDIALVELTKGKTATIDAADVPLVSAYKWCVSHEYAMRRDAKTKATIFMHRLIAEAPIGMQVDHINRNGLDNRRSNLRVCTSHQNLGNQYEVRGTSRFKGVAWDRTRKCWKASISRDHRTFNIGRFKVEEDAALAYDVHAREIFGEFAACNFAAA